VLDNHNWRSYGRDPRTYAERSADSPDLSRFIDAIERSDPELNQALADLREVARHPSGPLQPP
jgi:hypothetical protein